MSFIHFTYRFLCYLWDTIIKRKAFFACLTLIKQVRCSRPLLITNCSLFSFFCLGNVKVVATAYVCFTMGWNSIWNSWIILMKSAFLIRIPNEDFFITFWDEKGDDSWILQVFWLEKHMASANISATKTFVRSEACNLWWFWNLQFCVYPMFFITW